VQGKQIMARRAPKQATHRRGAMLALIAILLPMMLVLASFAINLAYMELTRTELRIASDAATRASGFTLMITNDQAAARSAAREGTTRNRVGGKATQLADSDIVFGISRRSAVAQRYSFTPGATPANAVSVNARRNAGSLSGMVGLIMPNFAAVDSFGPSQQAISTQVEVDIALVLDKSGSMAYGDTESSEAMAAAGLAPASAPKGWRFCDPAPPGSRWLDLVKATQVFLDTINASPQQECVSLVTYNEFSQREVELSSDYRKLPTALDAYTAKYCMGLTNIHDGIADGVRSLVDPRTSRPWAVKVLIVLTDGRRTAGSDPVPAAAEAFKQGIAVHTVTFSKEADQAVMRQVASAGGGMHYHVATGDELVQLFRVIARRLPTLLTQ
jgi:Ca-activated chloride channel family protein